MKRSEHDTELIWKYIVTFGGAGYIPFAPGTAGAIAALAPALIVYRFSDYPQLWFLALVIFFTIFGIIGSFKLEKDWGKDPQKIVVDEAVGMWITLLFIPFSWFYILLGFVFFRFFDIFKPLGIDKIQKLRGGYGVMADDILAGIAANLCLNIIVYLLN